MERRAPLIVQKALYCDEGMPDLPFVFIITNSGGVLQGDRYAIEIRVARDAFAHVTTQAATKIHEMDANHAIQTQEIVLEEGAYLELLPDQIIPYRRSRFLTRTRLEIHPTATLLYSEILICGRKYYRDGECFLFDLFSSTVHAERPDGSDLFTEKFVIEPGREDPRATGAMGGFDVFGNVILLTPRRHADAILAQAPAVFDRETQCAAGASRLPNDAGLIYKVLGMETEPVRARSARSGRSSGPKSPASPSPPISRGGDSATSSTSSIQYRRWESNPHSGSPEKDFKSSASAIPPRRPLSPSLGWITVRSGERRGWDSNPRKV